MYSSAPSYPAVNLVDPSFGADDAAIAVLFEEDEALASGRIPDNQVAPIANGFSKGVSEVKNRVAQTTSLHQKVASSPAPGARQQASICEQRLKKLQSALDQSRSKRAFVLQSKGAQSQRQGYQYHGVDGMQFIVNAPPGIGRLERLPFNVVGPAVGGAGTVIGDSIVSVPAGTAANVQPMATAQIPWAVVRLVGVEITRTINNPGGGAPDFYSLTAFNVGGGAELFLQQGVIDLDYFAAGLDRIPGLRDYPIVRSPNQAFISVAWQNSAFGGVTTAQDTIIGVDLLVDVLADDQFGSHAPGPYAR